ncbi:hypothetical protein F6X40_35605 [Paraburkholderia sp. UCT31]|uniref:hypothetical protein n=1 Tax=Paraburkholderia sp. UCT31 TaxID=2615209 RepID=UPI0016554DD0|nr:hypothetical protein [Paraburkholderia sp. UCT31]MBC8741877.1 hypothetical protein [Paraburkholderia sp. UCT31]
MNADIIKAIEAAKTLLGKPIVIQSDADFTPKGKRRVQLVRHALSGEKRPLHIRWYVGSKAYRTMPLTNENIALSNRWKTAAS